MKIKYQPSKFRTAAMLLLAVGALGFAVQGAFAADFFTNMQLTDQRSNGSDGAPGFNPCGTGGVVAVGGLSCSAGTGGLLAAANITAFLQAGPGAITDNMFGKVSGPALGSDGLAGGIGTAADTPTTNCAPGFGTAGFDTSTNGGLNGLNCGDVRIDPATQGQTIPTVGGNLTTAMATNEPMDMTSGTGATLHHSQFTNGFVWNPTTTPQNVPVQAGNMPTFGSPPTAPATVVCTGTSATNIAVCASQGMIETTGLSATQTSVLKLAASFSSTVDATGAMLTATPTVNWQSNITQDDMSGTSGAFTQELSGSFVYNLTGTTFASTQYPNGQSFTNQSITGASLP